MSAPFWVDERHESGSAIGFEMVELLTEERTPFQHIKIFESRGFGRVMSLDDCWMVTQRENHLYHEMMSHPALACHDRPSRVAIVGGGDCGVLQQVLRHPTVEQATQIEIDERVTRLSEQYFPELCSHNSDPRAQLLFEDGLAWVGRQSQSLDLLIIDSTDPVDMAAGLFEQRFYEDCRQALADDGILALQSESPLLHVELLVQIRQRLYQAGFGQLKHLLFPQPCYPSGWWSATLASASRDLTQVRNLDDQIPCRYYSRAIHQAAATLPPGLQRSLGEVSG
ncbi:MAG: polyamine aminopropyltransferase [Pseudomonadota bacterium]